MTDNEETIWATRTHPYVAALVIDPVMWAEFQSAVEGRPEMKVRKVDRDQPDFWTIHVACASRAVKHLLESNW